MTDDNNNADFESAVGETHPTLVPAPAMTRDEFCEKLETLKQNLREDHEELTGVTTDETHDWDYWMEQLTAAYINES